MKIDDSRWREYETGPGPHEYKGFRLVSEKRYKLMGRTHLIFTNGTKEIFVAGDFPEEAFIKMFDRIDAYLLNLVKNSTSNHIY